MRSVIFAMILAGAASAAPAQEEITTLPAEVRDIPVPVAICAGGLGAWGAALGLSLSNPATAVAAGAALLLCAIVVETELPG